MSPPVATVTAIDLRHIAMAAFGIASSMLASHLASYRAETEPEPYMKPTIAVMTFLFFHTVLWGTWIGIDGKSGAAFTGLLIGVTGTTIAVGWFMRFVIRHHVALKANPRVKGLEERVRELEAQSTRGRRRDAVPR